MLRLRSPALSANIRLGESDWRQLIYSKNNVHKRLIVQAPGAIIVKKFFSLVADAFTDKLEHLSALLENTRLS